MKIQNAIGCNFQAALRSSLRFMSSMDDFNYGVRRPGYGCICLHMV